MRRYRRNSVENWSWPLLFFKPNAIISGDIPQKSDGKIFWYWCTKRRTQSENQISPKEKQKTFQCFLFQNGSYRTPKSSPRKVPEKSGKIKFRTKNRVLRVLWRPRFCRGFWQVGYHAHNLRASSLRHKDSCNVCIKIICKHCFWKGALSDNFISFFCSFDSNVVFLDLLGLFNFERYLNRAAWPSTRCHFLNISSVKQFWGPLEAIFSSRLVGYIEA